MREVMPEWEYVENGGMRCPVCGSHNVWDVDPEHTNQVACKDCGSHWREEYGLIGYYNLVVPENK